MKILECYYGKIDHFKSQSVLEVIEQDINDLNDPYDPLIRYAGRGDSRTFHLSEWLVPEFEYNEIFYIHDKMYDLWKRGVIGYSKELADDLMYELLEYEEFVFTEIYYLAVKTFG